MTVLRFFTLLALAAPGWSQNVGTKWDVLEASGVAIARSPITTTYKLDEEAKAVKGPTGASIYVIGPTPKYSYCSVALLVSDDGESAHVSKSRPVSAEWWGAKVTAQKTSSHRLLLTSQKPMIKDPAQFIKSLKAYREVVLTFYLDSTKQTHVRVSLKGSTKAINRACQTL